jgi:hypothetical protein
MPEVLDPFDSFETAKVALQAAVIADGGSRGLFNKLRSDQFEEVLLRYDVLLEAATGPEDRERRREQQGASELLSDEKIDNDYAEIASILGVTEQGAAAMIAATMLCSTAFPGIPLSEIPTG